MPILARHRWQSFFHRNQQTVMIVIDATMSSFGALRLFLLPTSRTLTCPCACRIRFIVSRLKFHVSVLYTPCRSCGLRRPQLGRTIYEWEQSLDEVNLYIQPPPGLQASQVECTITPKHLRLGVKGNPPFIDVSGLRCPRGASACLLNITCLGENSFGSICHRLISK